VGVSATTETPRPVSALLLLGSAVYVAAWPALLLVLGGDARWVQGWLFAAWWIGVCTTVIAWLYRKDPALLAERYRRPGTGGESVWDRAWVYATGMAFLAWIVLTPLDARRFGWSPPFSPWLQALGGALLLASSFLLFRAFHDNTFLSPLVRIQAERKQRVVSTGVYGFVRHPMYLGALLMFLGAPMLLGSAIGLAVGAAITLLLVARIVGEERLLLRELDGYAAYQRKVRHRLLPFVW
jgi:protein-S-isoprenylcysteine O-methyltransferase Ste14